jgi:hypothetical protein
VTRPVAVPADWIEGLPQDLPSRPAGPAPDAEHEAYMAAVMADDHRAAAAPAPPRLRFQTMRELIAEVDAMGPPTWLFRGVWPADAYGVVAAEDKAGKTWAITDAAVAVAAGRAWLTLFACDRPGPVLVFVGEGGKRNTVRRLRAVAAGHGVTLEDLDIVVVDRVPHLSNASHLLELAAHLEQRPPRLVILDPLYLAARGANGSDLYAMGEALEGLQHLCQQAAAALLVVTHFRKDPSTRNGRTSDTGRSSSRITGVGPSAWGRVLITGAVTSRYTDPETKLSRVVIDWEVIGGEVADQSFRTVREVWADDPNDLSSPLHVTWARVEDDHEQPTARAALDDAKPAARRVFQALEKAGAPMTVKQLGDALAIDGRPLKQRTIQDALNSLGTLVDSIVVDSRGTCQWTVAAPRDPTDPGPAEPPPDEPDPWAQESLR